MAKVLLVDTSFAASPIYNYLLSQGHDVFVMGNRPSDALAIRAQDNWINQNYSDLEAVQTIIARSGFDYIVPGCTDLSIEICQRLSITPEFYDAPAIHDFLGNKALFRQLCLELELPAPAIVGLDDFPLAGKYICKPVDAFSGRGVTVCDGEDKSEVMDAYELAVAESTSSQAIIESYIPGQLFSYSVFIEQEAVVSGFTVREGSSVNPYAVDTSFVEHEFSELIINELKECVEAVASHLKLKDGLVHTQFILHEDRPYLIEMSRRCPGDLYPMLILHSTGYDYAGKYTSYYVSQKYDTKQNEQSHIIRHTLTSDKLVDFDHLEFNQDINLKAFYPLLPLGNLVKPKQKDRVGIIFIRASQLDEKYRIYQDLIHRDYYRVTDK